MEEKNVNWNIFFGACVIKTATKELIDYVFIQQSIRYTGNDGRSPAVTYYGRAESALLISVLYHFSPCMVFFFYLKITMKKVIVFLWEEDSGIFRTISFRVTFDKYT